MSLTSVTPEVPFEDELLTLKQVAGMLQRSTRTIKRYWKAGIFPRPVRDTKRDGRIRFLRWWKSDIIKWLNER